MKMPGKMNKKKFEDVMLKIESQYGDVFHEWNTRKAQAFFDDSGISQRNWGIYMRSIGLADGVEWTLRQIAEDEGNISHVRVWQIIQATKKHLKKFASHECQEET